MPLSPEIRRYAKQEGIDQFRIQNDLLKMKKSPSEQLVEGLEKGAANTTKGFFTSLTTARCLTGANHLFPWEQSYFENNPDAGDPRNAKTFRKLKKEGIDQRQMRIEDIQRTHCVDKKLLLRLADQATSRENRQSWLDFNTQLQKKIGSFIDSTYPQAMALGVAKGLLSTVPQNQDLAPVMLAGGALSDGIAATLGPKQHDLPNHLARMSNEFSQLLTVHYKTHSRSLATFTDFSPSEINEMSQRIFTGSRMSVEEMMAKTQAEMIMLGLAVAQGTQTITTDSLSKALLTMGIPIASALYLYQKVKNARKDAVDYTRVQKEYTEEIANISKEIASQRGARTSIDLYKDTEIEEKREKLVDTIRKGNQKIRRPNAMTPWNLALFSTGSNTLIPDAPISPVGPLITAGIIISAFSPFEEALGAKLHTTLRDEEVVKLEKFITSIDQSDYKVTRHMPLTESLVKTRKEALKKMRYEPLILYQVDTGSEKRKVSTREPLILNPGISFFSKAPSGTGKSELFRMIELVQGNLANIHIRKGPDLRSIDPKILPDLVYHVEAIPPDTEKTLGEELSVFFKDPDDNMLKKELLNLKDPLTYRDNTPIRIQNTIIENFGKDNLHRTIDILLSTNSRRDELIEAWVKNPLPADRSEEALACNALTAAFRNSAQKSFFKIENLSAASDFLKRKPGASKGSSTGQAVRWELFKATMKERAVLLLDEPAANLDRDNDLPHDIDHESSVALFAKHLERYMKNFPNTVILIASNDTVLDNLVINQAKYGFHSSRLVDKYIYPTFENDELIWNSKPIIEKLYQWNNLF